MILYSPNASKVVVHSDEEMGVVLERAVFDRLLAEEAAGAGAEVLTRADVDGLLQTDGQVEGACYTRLGRRCKVRAGVVIGADGVESRVGRWAGIHTQLKGVDLESAYQMVLAGIDFDHRYCHIYLGDRIAPGGYLWVFPKGDNVASVGIGVSVKLCDAGTAYRKLEEFIARRFGRPAIVGEMAGGVPVAMPLRDPVRNGLILAGDAARHCNPLTGGGIYTAMVAGHYAGTVAAEAAGKGDTTAKGLHDYILRIEEEILRPHKRAYRLKEGISKLTDEDFNRTAHQVLSLPPEKRTLRNIFLKALTSQPKLMVDIIKAFI